MHLPWLRQRPVLLALGLLALLVAGVIVSRRELLRRSKRRTFQLLPSRPFEPSIEDVRRFAAAVEAKPSLRRRLLGACEPTVLRLRRRGPDETVFLLEVPDRLGRRIRAACYPGVELIEIEPVSEEFEEAVAMREPVLRRDAVHPLLQGPLSPDPKGVFAQILDELGEDEVAEVAVALWPAGRAWHRHLARKRRSQSPSELLTDMWYEFKQNRPPARRRRNIPDKAAGVPVFRARIVVRVGAAGRERARALVSDLAWAFELWHGENSLRPGTLRHRLGPVGRRLSRGTLSPRRRQFLSLHELASWLHPPAGSCRGLHVARAEAAPAPTSLPLYRPPVPKNTDPTPPEAA